MVLPTRSGNSASLLEDSLTYDKAQKLLLSLEAAEKGIKDLADNSAKGVQYIQRKKKRMTASENPTNHKAQLCKHSKSPTDLKALPCKDCGGSHDPLKCRFRSAECHYCHKRGHIVPICRKRLKQQSGAPPRKPTHSLVAGGTETPLDYGDPMNSIQAVQSVGSREPYMVKVLVHGKQVSMEVDTGAILSVMPHETYLST